MAVLSKTDDIHIYIDFLSRTPDAALEDMWADIHFIDAFRKRHSTQIQLI